MKLLIILISLLSITSVNAGPFLDLDLGVHLTDYHEHRPDGTRWLGNENPLFILRVGYETNKYAIIGPVVVTGHVYYKHLSSAGTRDDTGVDALMLGLRLQ